MPGKKYTYKSRLAFKQRLASREGSRRRLEQMEREIREKDAQRKTDEQRTT